MWTSGAKLAQDERFLKQNKITHVVNCVAQAFPSPTHLGIQYLDLSLNDSMDQDLTQPILETLNFILSAKKIG